MVSLSPLARSGAAVVALCAIGAYALQIYDEMARHPNRSLAAELWRQGRYFTYLTNLLVAYAFARFALTGRAVPGWARRADALGGNGGRGLSRAAVPRPCWPGMVGRSRIAHGDAHRGGVLVADLRAQGWAALGACDPVARLADGLCRICPAARRNRRTPPVFLPRPGAVGMGHGRRVVSRPGPGAVDCRARAGRAGPLA